MLLAARSLISVPEQRDVTPSSWVNTILATALAALASAVDCGVTHLKSTSQTSDAPMSRMSFDARVRVPRRPRGGATHAEW